jgi:hypothetical protein
MMKKNTVFWDVIPYSLTDNYPEYGGSRFLLSGNCVLACMASYPIR